MQYISTRGSAPALSFSQAMMTGLARDGGLYVPEVVPVMAKADIAALAGLPYEEVAFRVMRPFLGDAFGDDEFRGLIARAYQDFGHAARAPLVQLGSNHFLLELFHGPTLAFKDFAMQLIGQMMQAALAKTGARITIVGATSGDTGSAAIEAFRGLANVDVVILYPHGRVSEVQRRQMTTPVEANVHAIAMDGDFDDCQARLKDMFNDFTFRDAVRLAGVNSINWARVLAQVVYYFSSAVSLGAPHRAVSFTVPTGNFGDIFAGYIARQMGLPIEKLVIATNQNDILGFAQRRICDERGETLDQPVDGHSGLVEFRTGAVRCLWPRRGGGGGADGRDGDGRVPHQPGCAGNAAGQLRLGPLFGGRNARHHPHHPRRHWRTPLPAFRRGGEGGGRPSGANPDDHPRHRASGEIPRCGGSRLRHSPATPPPHGRPLRTQGTRDTGAQ
jgi:threonine synthase